MTAMTRVLVGYDGSACADTALDLVARLGLPPGSTVRLATAVPAERELLSAWGALIVGSAPSIVHELSVQAEAALQVAAERLTGSGLTVERAVVSGRPSQALAAEAERFGAELVVVGSRGLGSISSVVLGSVSAELVDVASRPVLVARSGSVDRIVLAADGSGPAEAAERVLATLPVAAQVPVQVLSVAQILRPWITGVAPTMYQQVYAVQAEQEALARGVHDEIASDAVSRLAGLGIPAQADIRIGDAAAELIAATSETDLIVLGSRGRTGLPRLVLGSVARRVLQHAAASVLIVRQAEAADPATG